MENIFYNLNYIKIIVLVVLALLILYIIFRKLFKVASKLKIFLISLVTLILVSSITISIMYIKDVDYKNLGNKYYAYGRIVTIGNNQIGMKIVDHNLKEYHNSNIIVLVDKNTVLRTQNKIGIESGIEHKDLTVGNRVRVILHDNIVSEGTVTAEKILVVY